MFIADELVFVELHKTGSTHIQRLLGQVLDGRIVGKHNRVPPALLARAPFFLGSVRNPWEWYVSLWAFGCDGKGFVRARVTRSRGLARHMFDPRRPARSLRALYNEPTRDPKAWRETYRDVDDPRAFRAWIARMVHPRHARALGEGYGDSPLAGRIGLLTYRYLQLFCRDPRPSRLRRLRTYEDLAAFEREACFIDAFVRNENLEADLAAALEKAGIAIDEHHKGILAARGRTNASSRSRAAGYYYDAATRDLVADRERLIVDRFQYEPPALEGRT